MRIFTPFQPGDHIEKLNNVNVVGKRHYEVARLLKDIPTNSTFTLRLVEPMKSGFQGIGPRNGSKGSSKKGYGSGKETLRFKANGNAAVEAQVRVSINHILKFSFFFPFDSIIFTLLFFLFFLNFSHKFATNNGEFSNINVMSSTMTLHKWQLKISINYLVQNIIFVFIVFNWHY